MLIIGTKEQIQQYRERIEKLNKTIRNLMKEDKNLKDISKIITTTHYVDGTPNYTNIMVNEIVSEIYRAIREDMNVQTVIKPGGITFNGVGGNAGGPVNVTGVNINFTQGQAQCQ